MSTQPRFACTLTPQQKVALERLAEEQGESQSTVVRSLIRQEARRRGLWPDAEEALGR